MASSIFGPQGGDRVSSALAQLKSLGDPNAAFMQAYQANPEFRRFADSMLGKTPEQAFRENGLDYHQLRNLF